MKKNISKTIHLCAAWEVGISEILFFSYFLLGYESSIITLGLKMIPFCVIFLTALLFYEKLSLKQKCIFFALVPITIIPWSIFYTKYQSLEYILYLSYFSSVILISSLLIAYILIGILVATLTNKILEENSKFRLFKFLILILYFSSAVTLAIKPAFKIICELSNFHSRTQVKEIDSATLSKTAFTPVLDEKLIPKQNLIWCATYQLCWDNLTDYMKRPIKSYPPIDIVQKLNQENFNPKWIDNSTYIALVSGKKIDFSKMLEKKFDKKNKSELINKMPEENPLRIFFYSYLKCNLPFKWKFQRSKYAMSFCDGEKIESFGLRGYNPTSKKEQNCIEQILIKYCEEDETVIELKTKKIDHHLILAMVPPKKTLSKTIEYINKLIQKGSKDEYYYEENIIIDIPVIDFDLIKKYNKLSKLKIGKNEIIEESFQKIKFKLDESGAFVLSEAYLPLGLGGPVNNLVFNKPFLIMLRYKDAKQPYFAAWIANSELLKKTTKQTILEYYQIKKD